MCGASLVRAPRYPGRAAASMRRRRPLLFPPSSVPLRAACPRHPDSLLFCTASFPPPRCPRDLFAAVAAATTELSSYGPWCCLPACLPILLLCLLCVCLSDMLLLCVLLLIHPPRPPFFSRVVLLHSAVLVLFPRPCGYRFRWAVFPLSEGRYNHSLPSFLSHPSGRRRHAVVGSPRRSRSAVWWMPRAYMLTPICFDSVCRHLPSPFLCPLFLAPFSFFSPSQFVCPPSL